MNYSHVRTVDRKLFYYFTLEFSVKISDKVYSFFLKKINFSFYNFFKFIRKSEYGYDHIEK